MLRSILFLVAVCWAHVASAQFGYWPTMGAGSTAAGSAMTGMANAVSAQGSYNLQTSQAAINMTQADANAIQNQELAAKTYFDMRDMNQAYQASQRGPRPTNEQLTRMARDGAPRPISAEQIDPVSGRVDWPVLLQDESFGPQRSEVDKLVAKQATYGSLGLSDQNRARQSIDTMFRTLKGQIRNVPPQEYSTTRSFLDSLMFSMTRSRIS